MITRVSPRPRLERSWRHPPRHVRILLPPGGYYIERTLILPYFFIWMKVNFAQMNSLTLRECSKFTETCTGMLIGLWMGGVLF